MNYLATVCLFVVINTSLGFFRCCGKSGSNSSDLNAVPPEYKGDNFQGDIILPPSTKNGVIDPALRWKNGIIPYVITGSFSLDQRNNILAGMALYKRVTNGCVKFVPRVYGVQDYIDIRSNGVGCYSSVGRQGGPQVVNYDTNSCFMYRSSVVHELFHVIGYYHTQSRPDRNFYITVNTENIMSGKEGNFVGLPSNVVTTFNQPYDYNSIMHYVATAFSKNGRPTLTPKNRSVTQLGNQIGLTKQDIKNIRLMYNCP